MEPFQDDLVFYPYLQNDTVEAWPSSHGRVILMLIRRRRRRRRRRHHPLWSVWCTTMDMERVCASSHAMMVPLSRVTMV
jgi:hypothetical protein